MKLAVEDLTLQRLLILLEDGRDSEPRCAGNGLIRFARWKTASKPLYDGLEGSLPAASPILASLDETLGRHMTARGFSAGGASYPRSARGAGILASLEVFSLRSTREVFSRDLRRARSVLACGASYPRFARSVLPAALAFSLRSRYARFARGSLASLDARRLTQLNGNACFE